MTRSCQGKEKVPPLAKTWRPQNHVMISIQTSLHGFGNCKWSLNKPAEFSLLFCTGHVTQTLAYILVCILSNSWVLLAYYGKSHVKMLSNQDNGRQLSELPSATWRHPQDTWPQLTTNALTRQVMSCQYNLSYPNLASLEFLLLYPT